MRFRFTAVGTFEAHDLDEALRVLEDHFRELQTEDAPEGTPFSHGSLKIEPYRGTDPGSRFIEDTGREL